jgi:hypothetical protein
LTPLIAIAASAALAPGLKKIPEAVDIQLQGRNHKFRGTTLIPP